MISTRWLPIDFAFSRDINGTIAGLRQQRPMTSDAQSGDITPRALQAGTRTRTRRRRAIRHGSCERCPHYLLAAASPHRSPRRRDSRAIGRSATMMPMPTGQAEIILGNRIAVPRFHRRARRRAPGCHGACRASGGTVGCLLNAGG